MEKPKFLHDCLGCEFLFHRIKHDWYACKAPRGTTLVARASDLDSDYFSSDVETIKRWERENYFPGLLVAQEAMKIVRECNL